MKWRWIILGEVDGKTEVIHQTELERPVDSDRWPFVLKLPRLIVRQGTYQGRTETQIFIHEDLIDG